MPLWLIWLGLRARSTLGSVLGWVGRNPLQGALCAAVVALLLCWHVIDVRGRTIARLTAQANAFRVAQVEAGRIAQEAIHHQEAVYVAKAQDADHEYQSQIAAAQSATDRYIAGHRLRTDSTSGASATLASPQGSNPASPDRPDNPADMVAVSADDINACTVNSTRLQAARDWALGINSATP